MGEKGGQTEKLRYDFNTALCSEVQLQNQKWYRVTCKEFRSFNGPRRIGKWVNEEPVYEQYNGPIYYWNTNTKVKELKGFGTQYNHTVERQVMLRPHERHLLDYMYQHD